MSVRRLLSFRRNADGNVGIVFAFLLLPIVALGGAGVDLARHEAMRIELQDGLDRGVLAAASLTQTKDAENTIREYIKDLANADSVALTFTRQASVNSRIISASASYSFETAFIKLIGVDTLTVNAASTAQEAKQNIEMSLMLDMSGSMIAKSANSKTRLENLKIAASSFIDQVLTEASKDYTTISIVPYAGHVNVGAAVFDKLGGKRVHTDSSCFDIPATSYGADSIDFKTYPQLAKFTRWNAGKTDPLPWWCPMEHTSIAYLSNDATALKKVIADIRMHDGTGSQNAMQWGYMLLNPAAKPVVEAAISAGKMDTKFKSRPSAFTDGETMKIIVLMTDGLITEQFRPKDGKELASDSDKIYDTSKSAQYLSTICTNAKSKGITVFTIGFEIADKDSTQMKSCASSAGHYYSASGAGISDAFKSISTSIQKLRLTQ